MFELYTHVRSGPCQSVLRARLSHVNPGLFCFEYVNFNQTDGRPFSCTPTTLQSVNCSDINPSPCSQPPICPPANRYVKRLDSFFMPAGPALLSSHLQRSRLEEEDAIITSTGKEKELFLSCAKKDFVTKRNCGTLKLNN